MAIAYLYTIDYGVSFQFIDATGVTFTRKDKSGNIIEVATNVAHSESPSPASRIKYTLDFTGEVQGGDDEDIIEFNYDGSGNYAGVAAKVLQCSVCYTGYPVWTTIVLPSAEWVEGDDVGVKFGIDLNDSISRNDNVEGTVFTIHPNSVTPNGSDLPLNTVLNPDGTVTGVVAANQGGNYAMVFDAENEFGHETISQSIELLVGLPITAPTFNDIPDLGDVQRGASVSVMFADYLADDGNPNGTQLLLYDLADSSAIVADLSVKNLLNGDYSGTVSFTETLGLKTIVARVKNGNGLFDNNSFTLNVVANTATAPVATGWFSGEDNCAVSGVAPTWIAGGDTFNINLSDTSAQAIDLNSYIASIGSSAITAWAYVTDLLPAGLDLNTATGIVEGVHSEVAAFSQVSDFTATNGDISDTSPGFTFVIVDDSAASIPTITSISASEGSNDVLVILTEAVRTTNNTDAEYEVDFLFQVNGTTRAHTFKSGKNTNNLTFTLSGTAFSSAVTITMTYTA